MNLNKYHQALIIGILVVILVAWVDIQGYNLLGQEYTNGNFPSNVWPHHLLTAILIFLIPALCYWIFYRKDKSEAIGIFSVSLITFYFGLPDLFYFWLRGISVPATLPWLMGNPFIFKISTLLGNTTVTNVSLFISVGIGLLIAYFVSKWLKEKI